MPIKVITANIKSNPLMRQSYVDSDVAKVAELGDVIMWQEIAPQRYKDAVRKHCPSPKWDTRGLHTEAPISLRTDVWEVIESGYKKTHDGRKFVTPDRYVTWVVARRLTTNKRVVFVNTHFVSGAWSNHYPLTKAWRRVRWNHHYQMMDQIVTGFVNLGYTVVGGGDWNRGATPKFMPGQRWLATGGIDHLFTVDVPTDCTISLAESYHKSGLHTDHEPRIAVLVLGHPKRRVTPTKTPDFSHLHALGK